MADNAAARDKYGALKIVLDMLAIIAVAYVFAVYPFWLNYHGVVYGTPSVTSPTQIWLMLLGCIPGTFGTPWLISRYGASVSRKFPVTTNWRVQIAFILFLPLGMFVVFIARNWR